jgi:hypothetical protein
MKVVTERVFIDCPSMLSKMTFFFSSLSRFDNERKYPNNVKSIISERQLRKVIELASASILAILSFSIASSIDAAF